MLPAIPSDEKIRTQLSQAVQWYRQGHLDNAEVKCRKILAFFPDDADTLNLIGLIEYHRKKFERAIHFIGKAIYHNNQNPDFYNNIGLVFLAMGKLEAALKSYLRALDLRPDCASTEYNLGGVYLSLGEVEKAKGCYLNAISNKKDYYPAYTNLSAICNQLEKYDQALEYAGRGLQYAIDNPVLLNNMGNALKGLGRWEEAISAYRKSIEYNPGSLEGYLNLGYALQNVGKWHEAMHHYQKALQIDPNNAEILNNLGIVFKSSGKSNAAIDCFKTAIRIKPWDAFPYHNMGNILLDQCKYEEAFRYLDKAISLDPKLVEAHISIGIVQQDLGRQGEAIDSFLKAISINPDCPKAYNCLVRSLQHECRWEELQYYGNILDGYTQSALNRGEKPEEVPFLNVSRHCSPQINYKVAKAWSDHLACQVEDDKNKIRQHRPTQKFPDSKITIGYLSNNFKNHPTSHLIKDLFKYHNRDKFNIYCYSYGEDDGSIFREQIENDCDRFVDIMTVNHVEAAQKIYCDKVDILVDLVGHMRSNRLVIPALRPSPVQVRWLGMAGTSGGDFFDYILTDRIVTPEDQSDFYSETFVYLPNTYQINSNTQMIFEKKGNKQDSGLPEKGFVFASFCSTYKIDPVIFKVWMDILRRVPESVLWLLEPIHSAKKRLKNEAQSYGINPDRIIFAKKVDRYQHMARIGLADLCLDTRNINGAATTSEALWSGVPVLTIKGNHFASRMAASILSAVGLQNLITRTVEEYENLAVKIATNVDLFKKISEGIENKKKSAALFNTEKFVEDLEFLFEKMWLNCIRGKKGKILDK